METVKTNCPNCGAEIEITVNAVKEKKNRTIKFGNGEKVNAEKRIEALKAAGINTEDFFTITNSKGEGVLMKWDGGIPVAVQSDEVIEAIREKGVIPERRLFRRWVTGQMFEALSCKSYSGKKLGFNEWLKWHPYEYQWKTLVEELRIQAKLYKTDKENFYKRHRWINGNTLIAASKHYMTLLKEVIESRQVRKCKGREYKRIGGDLYFCDEIEAKILKPLRDILGKMNEHDDPQVIYCLADAFNQARVHLGWGMKKCPEWIDAFKGAGAYYTMENLILFGGCLWHGEGNGKIYDQKWSMKIIDNKADAYCNGDGWRMFAAMKKLLEDNNIDIEERRKQWAEAKKLRKLMK